MTDSRIPDVYQHPDGRIAIDRRPANYGVLVTDASGWVTPEVHLSVPAGFVRLVPETEAGAFVGDDPALAAYRAEAREEERERGRELDDLLAALDVELIPWQRDVFGRWIERKLMFRVR